jgi:Holliday junction DNA helicase RuvA
MITTLHGTVTHHRAGFLILEVAGIGYKVMLPEDRAHELAGEVRLYTHEVIRESERELFGFLSLAALELFWKLLSVSGVGPRSAQKIVYAGAIEDVKGNIMNGNLAFLTDVPGIGKKTAQKIILELKGTFVDEPLLTPRDADAVEALVGLGYARRQAEEALSGIEGATTEERIRAALKFLSR